MLVAVRASAPVAAMPPNSGHKTLATPSATSSALGSCLVPDMPSETTAASSDSMAPSMAMANAGPMSACSRPNEKCIGAPPGPAAVNGFIGSGGSGGMPRTSWP